MNQYKLDWYLASQVVAEVLIDQMSKNQKKIQDSHPFHRNSTNLMLDHVTETVARSVMTYALPTIMKHLSQNQLKGTLGIMGRVGGRVGLRAVPVIGAALFVKDAYEIYDFLTD